MGPTDPSNLNPYAPPRAELDTAAALGDGRRANLENAVAGRYDFRIGDVIDEAWRLVKGMKATFWGAAIVIGLICLLLSAICGGIYGFAFVALFHKPPNAIANQFVNGVVLALLTPLTMGVLMMCVRRALGAPISFGTAFSYFSRSGTALVAALLVMLMTWLGFALLIIPGIYLAVGYQMVTQLVCDQGLSARQAMETSRKAIHHKWWRVFAMMFLVGLLTGVSALGLLIPLIWTIPWSMMTGAILYRRIFCTPAAVETAPPPVATTSSGSALPV